MALYGFNMQPISRLRGQSITQVISYILRDIFYDPYKDKIYDRTSFKDLLFSEVILPGNAPDKFDYIDELIREIEKAEKRYDARVGRVVRLSLPNKDDFSVDELAEAVSDFVSNAFVSEGLCVVYAIHEGKNKDPEKNNPHAHVVITDRPVDSNGFCPKKNRSLNKKSFLLKCRRMWADTLNRLLQEKGLDERVSHLSYEVQGIGREPTVTLGRTAMALERKGIKTEKGNKNREIEARNEAREEEKRLRQDERERNRSRGRERSR